jgi:hypothetical protein
MAGRIETKFATIASGASVSGTVALVGADLFGLWAPVVTSCQIFLQGNYDTTPANFVRLQNPAGSGDWAFAVGAGSKAISLQDVAFPWPYLRVETSVAQTDVRTFAIPVKIS